MDSQAVVSILKDLGLPAAIPAMLAVVAKAIADHRQRTSKASLLEWLEKPQTRAPFAGDSRALKALDELHKSLIFEAAFKLRADTAMREQLLRFADENRDQLRLAEVLDAGRMAAGLPLHPHSSLRAKGMFAGHKAWKPLGMAFLALGYVVAVTGIYLAIAHEWKSQLPWDWGAAAAGLVFGGLISANGVVMLRTGRRLEVCARFLAWQTAQARLEEATPSESQIAKPPGAA